MRFDRGDVLAFHTGKANHPCTDLLVLPASGEKTLRIEHNDQLYRALAALGATIEPDMRNGVMFGCPAIFVGRKMAACIYGDEIGLKMPASQAAAAIAAGRAKVFTPYGKKNMREWIALSARADNVEEIADLLRAALSYAKSKATA